jgi:ADP-ribose pyrophosphatase
LSAGFKKVDEREVWRGHSVWAAEATFTDPDGKPFERDIVHHPGAVAVVPVVDQGDAVLLVRQYRAPVDEVLLELPAGKRDVPGEAADLTARRELEEEAGMRAGRLEKLVESYLSPGFCDERITIYMALDLSPCPPSAQGIEEQHMTIEKVGMDEIPALIASGAIVDAKTIIGLCLARDALA